jgi:hypothetical protein
VYVPANELCSTPGRKRVQATLTGTGEMAKLSQATEVVELFWPKCEGWNSERALCSTSGLK